MSIYFFFKKLYIGCYVSREKEREKMNKGKRMDHGTLTPTLGGKKGFYKNISFRLLKVK